MLPDFAKLKKELRKSFAEYVTANQYSGGILSGVRKQTHFEGNKHSFAEIGESMEENTSSYEEVSEYFEISDQEIIEKGINALRERVLNLADKMKDKIETGVISKISETVNKTGNIVNTNGTEFSLDAFFEGVEKLYITFDKQGNPRMPSIIMHPDVYDKLRPKLQHWNNDPEVAKRMAALIDRKREEWNARESNRKLVD